MALCSPALRVLDLVFPPRAMCLGCGDLSGCPEDYLCAKCRQALEQDRPALVYGTTSSHLARRFAAHGYAGPSGNLVRALKYRGVRALAPIMAADMVEALLSPPVGEAPPRLDSVVAVPMHPLRRYVRGFNQAELLARAVAEELGLPLLSGLRRVRWTRRQVGLSGLARRRNLSRAFAADPEVAGQNVLLVDDVCTTGGTAEACAGALHKAGAENVYLLTFARA